MNQVRRVLWIVLFLNLTVAATKAVIGWKTGSLGVLGDALHSTTDGLSNIVALIGIGLALQPPDREHPYGHAKFETLAGMAIAGFLLITGFELIREAIARLLEPAAHPVSADPLSLALLGGTFLVNLGVTLYEARAARRLGSDLLAADAAHTRSDLLVTLSLLAGLWLASQGWRWLDPLVSIAIAGVILASGMRIFTRTMPTLVDEAYHDPAALCQVAMQQPGVLACYAVRTRGKPGATFTELTIGVAPDMTVQEAHALTERVEAALRKAFGPMEIVMHVEPSGLRAEARP